jgi:drug/metabolite transporter (DMT)-like permease
MNGQRLRAALRKARASWRKRPGNLRGAVLMMISGVMFTGMSSLVKDLGERYDPFQVAFFRCLFGFVVLLPLILPHGLQTFHTRHPVRHLTRGLVGVSAMACMFYGLTTLPLADVTAISFGVPMFLIILAVLFLGERVRWRRSTATAVGFIGVIVMLRPGAGTVEPAALVVVGGTLLVAMAATGVKLLSRTESTLTMLAWFGLISTVAMALPAALVWRMPTLEDWALLGLVGAIGSLAQSFVVRAYTVGEATAVAPFDYVRMIYAVAVGIVLFDEWPDLWTLAGALIIVGSALYIARREARLDASQRLATPREPDEGSGQHPG